VILGPTEIRPVPVSKSAGASLPAALAGKIIEARLMMALGDGVFRFTSAENEFDLPLPRSLPPGTQVRITPQPNGSYQLTVLDEGAQAAASRPSAPLPPLTFTVRPQTPLPAFPAGQPIDAKVVSNPANGTVRIAVPQGEIDLPIPRSLPPGTPIRLVPQSGGAIMVSVPGAAVNAAPAQSASTPPPVAPHPSVFTVKPEGAPPQLPPGQVIEARVISNTANNVARFTSPDGEFELPLPKSFPPGTQARIVAQPGGSFVVTVRPDSAPSPAHTSATNTARPAGAPTLPAPITIKPSALLPLLPAAPFIDARVVSPSAGGLMRFTAPSGDFELPMMQPLPPGMPVRILPQPNGGLTVIPLNDVPEAAPAKPASPPMTPADAVKQTAINAIGKQGGLAGLFADIEDLPYRLNAPVNVRRAADALLLQRLPLDSVTRPHDLAKAIAGSGLFAERMLGSLPQMQANAPPDLKLALFVLRAALGSWSSARGDASVRGEAQLPPPAPGMSPAAQAPAESAHPRGTLQMKNMPPGELVPRLLTETDAALARINLHQIASLPDERMASHKADAPDGRWSCEVPVNVDGRTAMFGFVVERDGRHGAHDKDKKKWRVRAALDLPDTGAVEADVRLRGDAVSAAIHAERAETAALLEEQLPVLRDGLTAAGFEVESLSVRIGKPASETYQQRHFVDRKT
jgi:hypothetical protein